MASGQVAHYLWHSKYDFWFLTIYWLIAQKGTCLLTWSMSNTKASHWAVEKWKMWMDYLTRLVCLCRRSKVVAIAVKSLFSSQCREMHFNKPDWDFCWILQAKLLCFVELPNLNWKFAQYLNPWCEIRAQRQMKTDFLSFLCFLLLPSSFFYPILRKYKKLKHLGSLYL